MTRADVIIAGLGTMGAACAMALARAGVRVVGFDKFAPPHGFGEHGGRQRMFRMSYYEHAGYVPLLKRAREMWVELNTECVSDRGWEGRGAVYEETGAVYVGQAGEELMDGSLQAARGHGLEHKELTRGELMRRYPQFEVGEGDCGVWERRAGFVRCEDAVEAMVGAARGAGAEVRCNEAVVGWEADGVGVIVKTTAGTYAAGSLVLCAGPWSGALLGELGVHLRVTRQVQAWVRPENAAGFAVPGFCCWAKQIAADALLYGFPVDARSGLMKVAVHRPGKTAEPDRVNRIATESDVQGVQEQVDMHLRGAGKVVEASVCLYTNSPDSHFIIDRHPRHANVVLACGFSGHGFKFAPVVGEVVRDLFAGGAHSAPFLGLARFGGAA